MQCTRCFARRGSALAALSLAALGLTALVPLAGCTSALATAMYVIKGTDVDAEYYGLKDQKVVVVCRPMVSLQYRNSGVARDLAHQVGLRLADNVPKIRVVDQQDVSQWTDENQWEDYAEIGKALEADMVVAIDLEDFHLYQGQTLYQGQANINLRVYDMKQGGKVVFEKTPPQSLYPPNTGIPTAEKQEAQFRRQFVGVLSDEIGRHFYDHDSRAHFASDSTAF